MEMQFIISLFPPCPLMNAINYETAGSVYLHLSMGATPDSTVCTKCLDDQLVCRNSSNNVIVVYWNADRLTDAVASVVVRTWEDRRKTDCSYFDPVYCYDE